MLLCYLFGTNLLRGSQVSLHWRPQLLTWTSMKECWAASNDALIALEGRRPKSWHGAKKRTPTDRKQLLWTLNIISPYTEGYTRQHAWNCVFFSVHLFSAAMNKKLNRTTFCWGSPAQDWNHEKKWKSLRHLKNLCQDLDTWINTTMISFRQSSEYGNVGPLPNGRTNCLYIGLTNCLLTGMILQARTVGTPSKNHIAMPIGSMNGIFTYIYHKNQPNVGKYTIHGSLGMGKNNYYGWRFISRIYLARMQSWQIEGLGWFFPTKNLIILVVFPES